MIVTKLRLKDDYGVGIANRSLEQTLGIVNVPWSDDLEPRK